MCFYIHKGIQKMRQISLLFDRHLETVFILQGPDFISLKIKETLAAVQTKSQGLLGVMPCRLVNIYLIVRRSFQDPAFLSVCPKRRSVFTNRHDITTHKIWIFNWKPIVYLTHKTVHSHCKNRSVNFFGTVRPLYRTGVSLLSREHFLYI